MPDPSEIIIEVQLALNYLKLCADHQNPVGGGVPVDIVAMPDFIVDIDGYAVTQINEKQLTTRLASAEVGSRAGRVLSILAHLRDLDDEGFRLHYIAKTGAVGLAILNQRLNTELRRNHLQPLRFPLLLPAAETRYAVLGRDQREFAPRQVLKNNAPLTLNDLTSHFYDPIDTIANAAAVYFGTDSLEQFTHLLHLAVLGTDDHAAPAASANNRFVLVDISTIHDASGQPCPGLSGLDAVARKTYDKVVTELNRRRKANESATRLIVMVMSDRRTDLSRLWTALKLRKDTDTLLAYDKEIMHVFTGGSPPHRIPVAYQQRPGGRDAFVAGFLLHRALAAAWDRIPPIEHMRHITAGSRKLATTPAEAEQEKADLRKATKEWKGAWSDRLFPNPYRRGAEDPWPLSKALVFATALARLWNVETDVVPDKRNLLFMNLAPDVQKQWNAPVTASSPCIAESFKVLADADDPPGLFLTITLLTRLWLQGRMNDALATRLRSNLLGLLDAELTIHPDLWVRKGNRRSRTLRLPCLTTVRSQFVLDALARMSMERDRWQRSALEPHDGTAGRACLFDLDGTLIQSSGLRRRCLRRAFLSMLSQEPELGLVDSSNAFPAIPEPERLSGFPPNWQLPKLRTLLDRCETLYHLAIYNDDHPKEWKQILDAYPYYAYGDTWKDFRQVWNHPLSYPVFARVIEGCLTSHGLDYSPLPRTPSTVIVRACCGDCYEDIARDLKSETASVHTLLGSRAEAAFHSDVALWEAQYRKEFQAAATAYWRVDYESLPHTRHVLRTLRDVLWAKLYVVTEGHHETQLRKLIAVELDEFFPEYRTLSTGAASTPTDHLRSIGDELHSREVEVTDLQAQKLGLNRPLKGLRAQVASLSDRKNGPASAPAEAAVRLAQYGDLIAKDIQDIDTKLDQLRLETRRCEFYKELWTEYEKKELCAIYSLIVSCIMADLDKPVACLTNFHDLELALQDPTREARSLAFAMIGDRESKDVQPLLECWLDNNAPPDTADSDPVTTIRLLTWDHRQSSLYWLKEGELNENGEPNEKPVARYVAWNPLHALLFLSSRTSWPEAQGYYTLPPIMKTGLLTADPQLNSLCWETMAWGDWHEKPTCEMMNYIITRSSSHGPRGQSRRLAEALAAALHRSSPAAPRPLPAQAGGAELGYPAEQGYHFAWLTAKRLLAIVSSFGAPEEEVRGVALVIRDAACAEIRHGAVRGNWANEQIAVSVLRKLAGPEKMPALCVPPEDHRAVWNALSDRAQLDLGRAFFAEWAAKAVVDRREA